MIRIKHPLSASGLSASFVVLASLLSSPALAQTSNCSFSSMGGTLIDFGVFPANQSTAVVAADNIEFSCSDTVLPAVSYVVTISEGSSNDFTKRTMRFGGAKIDYNLYVDATQTQIFGNGQPSSGTSSASGACLSGTSCIVPVYGRIDGGQSFMAGQFSDSVVVTIAF